MCGDYTPRHPSRRPAQDHPRVCGDYLAGGVSGASDIGSPPRVRGLQRRDRRAVPRHRITPACAGTTAARAFAALILEDHPRVCGDYHACVFL